MENPIMTITMADGGRIAATKTDGNDRPLTEQKIASIRVDTKGEDYPEPNKLRDPYGRG